MKEIKKILIYVLLLAVIGLMWCLFRKNKSIEKADLPVESVFDLLKQDRKILQWELFDQQIKPFLIGEEVIINYPFYTDNVFALEREDRNTVAEIALNIKNAKRLTLRIALYNKKEDKIINLGFLWYPTPTSFYGSGEDIQVFLTEYPIQISKKSWLGTDVAVITLIQKDKFLHGVQDGGFLQYLIAIEVEPMDETRDVTLTAEKIN